MASGRGGWGEELTAVILRRTAGSGRSGRRRIDGDQSFGEREIREGEGNDRQRGGDKAGGGGEEGSGQIGRASCRERV